jgi:hypothetical protein
MTRASHKILASKADCVQMVVPSPLCPYLLIIPFRYMTPSARKITINSTAPATPTTNRAGNP